ncbi:uncharacterized protein BDR25DRAFT_300105 [Lindgomyces ingoldianus]|uniref:Uncharacterized protein n=1 Tax=Lindgomyces ingoldianus TaxID=673940 RepID=A0ACB6RE33_9PLEO|nr:uncharacterized protein BDR25DRAFT_300105 [Lindgomyces ingoldianus]KAF2477008.1 hypothetical protein BDR25DRAFT_300105 [Lindgomyces ingoldianus]
MTPIPSPQPPLLSLRSLPNPSLSGHEAGLWIGVGVLLGFAFISLVLGALEQWRGNSPKAFRAKVDELKAQASTISTQKMRIQALENIGRDKEETIADLVEWKIRKKRKSKAKEGRIRELEEVKRELQEEMARRMLVIDQNNAEIEMANRELTARGETIATHTTTIRNITIERNELRRDLVTARRRLGVLEVSEQRLLQQVNFHLEEVLERDAEIARKDAEIARKDAAIARKEL